ncbi:MAG: histone deacetylase family protein [Caulobacterales bacterium]|nr:histone deacetylase family protein [Caulobacterales bacterium]
MTTALITHPACLEHVTPPGHPERVDRLRAILAALEAPGFAALQRVEAPRAPRAAIEAVHDPRIVDLVETEAPEAPDAYAHFDADTAMSQGSPEAAMRAAGAVVAAVDGVMGGVFANAFCAVRPPGHHAERARPMGFCLFNNAAVGAAHAAAAHGLSRVAIVDFDVHHGNGSQEFAYARPDMFYGSIHQGGIYPGTGLAAETGPANNVANAPAPSGMDGPAWRRLFAERVLPPLDAYEPELIIISAGFDGHRADPLAGLALEDDDFAWATREIARIARAHAGGRLVSTLEGGYDLDALARSASAHVRELMDA